LASGDQQIPHASILGSVLDTQEVPFDEVIHLFVPVLDTAQNMPSSGDQQTERQALAAAAACAVHAVPLGEVITRLVPLPATATNNVKSEDQQTPRHKLSSPVA
jgi:hypothetical protein